VEEPVAETADTAEEAPPTASEPSEGEN